ncbi:RNA-binding protein [Virgibacillus profundi]|uniref:RNA-binding protein n=1 Tax=Virgibacillus profundi TaxID=2024555 RepID=A0A2A2IF55_9BACI|nr:YlmH/Sll1252 family protein [Virgibacillus profundi]PAV29926.1 RNA-binding protein [Virgibacillus profundi]PXY54098.1 RNA-binding protein [Virgibacillus profundi]
MDIYQHFRKEEQPFIDQVLSWKEQVEQNFQYKLSDFLDPREQQIIEMLIGTANEELKLYANGGGDHAERSRMVIAPFYEEVTEETHQLTLLQATYQDKFITLEHPDVMGAFLSLGIKRKKLGDIFVGDGLIQIILADEIAPYVKTNLTSIKRATIRLEEKPLLAKIKSTENWVEVDKTISSLRLDTVLKEIYNISRKEAAEYISKLLVKVNYKVIDDGKFILQEKDLLSVRGKGRSKLVKINGRTKKENWKITTAILK